MKLEERSIWEAAGTILMHNVASPDGSRVVKKGTRLAEPHLAQLSEAGRRRVAVAVLGPEDVHEDAAAAAIGASLQSEWLSATRPLGGRVNLVANVDGLLEVDADRLFEINLLPGVAVATRRSFSVVGPGQDSDNVATLKIIPYAIPRATLERAVALAGTERGILTVRPFQRGRRAALLLVGEPAVQEKLRDAFVPATRIRLQRLHADLVDVEAVEDEQSAIAQAAARLSQTVDLLLVAGQTSIMDEDDTTLRALREAGATGVLSGTPVEPGNLLALAYLPNAPVLCAPGSARGLKQNAVDLVLPRLLLGDRLSRREIAALGLGGFLTKAERAGE